jgi:VWFA-related protein
MKEALSASLLTRAAVRALLPAVAVAAFGAVVFGQQPTFRSSIELVRVDVVVVDKDGRAVRGLPKDAFTVADRGKVQTIATFDEFSHDAAVDAAAKPTLPPTLRRNVATNAETSNDRVIMVVIDDLHIYRGRTDQAKSVARKLLEQITGPAWMAVVFTSGDNSTQVTQDRATALAAIDTLKGRQPVRRPHQVNDHQRAASIDPESDMNSALDTVAASQAVKLDEFQDNLRQFETLKIAATMLLAEERRRKTFVMISEGMGAAFAGLADASSDPTRSADALSDAAGAEGGLLPETFGPGYHQNGLRDMVVAMRKADVSLFAIDPRGKVKPEDMALESFPPPSCGVCGHDTKPEASEDSTFRWNNPIRQAQDGLTNITGAANGFAVTDTDDFDAGISQIVENIDHYYVLGFYPADADGTKYRPLTVKVPGHPEYTVRFRRGYLPQPPAAKNKNALVELAAGVTPKSDLPLRLTAVPLPGKGKRAEVEVAIEVTAPTARLLGPDKRLHDQLSYTVLVVDDKKSKVTERQGRDARLVMSGRPGGSAMPETVTYQIPLTLELAPGRYQLRASAESRELAAGGSVYLDVVVPDFEKAPLVLSDIVLGYANGPRVPVGRVQTLAAALANRTGPRVSDTRRVPFELTLDRTFGAEDALGAYLEIARRDETRDVDLVVTIIDASNHTVMALQRRIEGGAQGRLDFGVPLATLGPGAYRLRVSATDARTVAHTETGFIVRVP